MKEVRQRSVEGDRGQVPTPDRVFRDDFSGRRLVKREPTTKRSGRMSF